MGAFFDHRFSSSVLYYVQFQTNIQTHIQHNHIDDDKQQQEQEQQQTYKPFLALVYTAFKCLLATQKRHW